MRRVGKKGGIEKRKMAAGGKDGEGRAGRRDYSKGRVVGRKEG